MEKGNKGMLFDLRLPDVRSMDPVMDRFCARYNIRQTTTSKSKFKQYMIAQNLIY